MAKGLFNMANYTNQKSLRAYILQPVFLFVLFVLFIGLVSFLGCGGPETWSLGPEKLVVTLEEPQSLDLPRDTPLRASVFKKWSELKVFLYKETPPKLPQNLSNPNSTQASLTLFRTYTFDLTGFTQQLAKHSGTRWAQWEFLPEKNEPNLTFKLNVMAVRKNGTSTLIQAQGQIKKEDISVLKLSFEDTLPNPWPEAELQCRMNPIYCLMP